MDWCDRPVDALVPIGRLIPLESLQWALNAVLDGLVIEDFSVKWSHHECLRTAIYLF
jgi:hypothetical protein